jgi:dienelactone hydrolase
MKLLLVVLVLISPAFARAGIVGKEVTYTSDSLTMKGYLAYDDAVTKKRPGILVVHEWWGLNANSRKKAEMLAGLGYVALALDMYGNGKTADHPDDAGKFAGEVMSSMPVMKARFIAAMELLKHNEHVDASQIGAIGFCFGGGVVLAMAREGADLKAVVCFHGSISTKTPAKKGSIKSKILVCNGADDKFVTPDAIKDFKAEMKSAGAEFQFINYPGAVHGFTNPEATELGKKFNLAIAYNENADKKSWEEMKKLFAKTFKK